jgi:dTDP-4-dehydrorhamnose 3,5-epimerase
MYDMHHKERRFFMELTRGMIDGVIILPLKKYVDERGYLIETFRFDTLPEGLKPEMSYVSYTEPGIGRGPHEHQHQTDIFSFIGPGNFKVYMWDNKKSSASFGKRMIFFSGQDNPLTVIVPPGVVHGYKNISRTTPGMVLNYPDKLYAGWGKKEAVDEIRHEDEKDLFYKEFMSL